MLPDSHRIKGRVPFRPSTFPVLIFEYVGHTYAAVVALWTTCCGEWSSPHPAGCRSTNCRTLTWTAFEWVTKTFVINSDHTVTFNWFLMFLIIGTKSVALCYAFQMCTTFQLNCEFRTTAAAQVLHKKLTKITAVRKSRVGVCPELLSESNTIQNIQLWIKPRNKKKTY